jgi:hypothetical protein
MRVMCARMYVFVVMGEIEVSRMEACVSKNTLAR